ncbi:MAG: hypothetical protein AAFX40_10205 [Cyanobacteria bacterium J06639_1]
MKYYPMLSEGWLRSLVRRIRGMCVRVLALVFGIEVAVIAMLVVGNLIYAAGLNFSLIMGICTIVGVLVAKSVITWHERYEAKRKSS